MNLNLGRRGGPDVVGLDVQPGFVAAVKARVNGSILAERAAVLPLPADVVRDGEVMDQDSLAEALRELFGASGMGKRVRVGVANQRTVLRTLELPPITDRKELAAAVGFQAQEQVPMPLSNAVLDFHPLGIVDTPAGPRQRVVLVAAQRDMVEKLLGAVRRAGLTAGGVDLSAFALIRSLYRPEPELTGRVLYLNVDGLTNLAIAEGTVCRFTRVVGSGLEGIASELAERRGIALSDARALIAGVDLTAGPPVAAAEHTAAVEPAAPAAAADPPPEGIPADAVDASVRATGEDSGAPDGEDGLSYEQMLGVGSPSDDGPDAELVTILENGVREISGEVRNSLDFHRSQYGGGEVSHIVLSGGAQDVPGFAEALQASLGVEVRGSEVGMVDERLADTVSPHRLAVAAGLAAMEVPQ
ncbi:MAG TPA: pilus assembly protein PilM [Solirubrobacteraceae bacterium]|jgi:type IV pilus assembly protein PilM